MPLTLTEINFRPKRNMPTFPIIPLKKKKKIISLQHYVNYKTTITYPLKDKRLSPHREKKKERKERTNKKFMEGSKRTKRSIIPIYVYE